MSCRAHLPPYHRPPRSLLLAMERLPSLDETLTAPETGMPFPIHPHRVLTGHVRGTIAWRLWEPPSGAQIQSPSPGTGSHQVGHCPLLSGAGVRPEPPGS